MHQYLLGHGYWSYVDEANDATPETTHRDSSAWQQAASGKQGNVALRIHCNQPVAQSYPRREDAEGGLGKSEKDFRHEYHGSKVATQAIAQ